MVVANFLLDPAAQGAAQTSTGWAAHVLDIARLSPADRQRSC